jgi:hypothetical protein
MMGRRSLSAIVLIAALSMPLWAFADSLVDTLLRIAGLTVAPSQLRGPEDVDTGSIWIAYLDLQTVSPVTPDSGYRSPVFSPAGNLIALKGDAVVLIALSSGTPATIQRVPGARKLVGVDSRHPDRLVMLRESDGSPLVVLSLEAGAVTPLPYDKTSGDHKRMLAQIQGQNRVYGTTRLTVKTESKQGLSRIVQWTDVYLQRGEATSFNVSGCDGVNCGQPALSPDGRRVAFVKTTD